MKMLFVVVEAMEKLGYRPETEIAFIFQQLAVVEDTSLLKDRLNKVQVSALYVFARPRTS
jgi:hypothetical protein